MPFALLLGVTTFMDASIAKLNVEVVWMMFDLYYLT